MLFGGRNIVDFGISLVALCQEWRLGCSLWGIQWTFGLQQYSFLFDVTSCQFLLSTPKKGHSESHCNSCISPPKMASLLIIGCFMWSHCVTECADNFTTATVSFSALSLRTSSGLSHPSCWTDSFYNVCLKLYVENGVILPEKTTKSSMTCWHTKYNSRCQNTLYFQVSKDLQYIPVSVLWSSLLFYCAQDLWSFLSYAMWLVDNIPSDFPFG